MGYKSTMVNYSSESVSTDYVEIDRLYFEKLSRERDLDYNRDESDRVSRICWLSKSKPSSYSYSIDCMAQPDARCNNIRDTAAVKPPPLGD